MKNKLLRKLMVLFLLIALSMGLVLSGATAAEPKYDFVLVCNVTADPFFPPLIRGMEVAGELLNVKVTFTGPTEWDIRKQRDIMDTIVDTDVDGIGVFIPEDGTFNAPIERALAMGIPVVSFNDDDPTSPRMAFIGQSDYEAGVIMGEQIAELLPPGSRIMVGISLPGENALESRKQGVIDAVKDYDMQVDTVFTPYMEPAKLMAAIEAYYAVNPDVKALLATDAVVANMLAKFTVERSIEDEVIVAGFDLLPRLTDYIRDGTVAFTIDQQPFLQGFQTVMQLYLYKEFGLYPTNIQTGGAVIDKTNVERVSQGVEDGYR